MNVLLISPNIEFLPDPVFPIGLAYIAAALKENHTPYEILDLCFEEDYETAISNTLLKMQPDVIGLSLRNVDNVSYPNYVSYLSFYQRIIQVIRKYSRGTIVVGGSGFDLMPDDILEYLGADLGVIGGEGRSPLLNSLIVWAQICLVIRMKRSWMPVRKWFIILMTCPSQTVRVLTMPPICSREVWATSRPSGVALSTVSTVPTLLYRGKK